MDLNSKEALIEHGEKIKKKGFLNKLYLDFYKSFRRKDLPEGQIVELGSGGGFIKEVIPNTLTSDLLAGPGIDLVFSASSMPFADDSVSAFLMINVFHHIKDPKKALSEMNRSLKKSGRIIMIEPYISRFGFLIYKYFHHEKAGFDLKAGWKIPGRGRMSDANPAMPWIIFIRDRKRFEKKYPELKIIKVTPHTPFRYLISGGLSGFQLLPTFLYQLVDKTEKLLYRFNKYIGLFVTIELLKK